MGGELYSTERFKMNELDLTFWCAWLDSVTYVNGLYEMNQDDLPGYCMGGEL